MIGLGLNPLPMFGDKLGLMLSLPGLFEVKKEPLGPFPDTPNVLLYEGNDLGLGVNLGLPNGPVVKPEDPVPPLGYPVPPVTPPDKLGIPEPTPELKLVVPMPPDMKLGLVFPPDEKLLANFPSVGNIDDVVVLGTDGKLGLLNPVIGTDRVVDGTLLKANVLPKVVTFSETGESSELSLDMGTELCRVVVGVVLDGTGSALGAGEGKERGVIDTGAS